MKYFNKKTIEDVSLFGKRVLLRCDFNVLPNEDGKIINSRKIDESLKTIKYLVEHGAKIIICSHMGKPEGKIDQKLSLRPVAEYLSAKLGFEVKLSNDVVGESTNKLCSALEPGKAILLENLKFRIEEQNNDEVFSQKLASLADVFVNDAFGVAHKEYASTYGVTNFLPSVGGFLMQEEIETLCSIFKDIKRPFVFILGGAKVLDKFDTIHYFLEKVDTLIFGGGIAYTFMHALGYSVGSSICEYDKTDVAKDIMVKAKEKGVKLVMPLDNVVGLTYNPDTEYKLVNSDSIPEGWIGMDIGPKTEKLFADTIKSAGTVVWSGSMGAKEWESFSSGTSAVARAVAESEASSVILGKGSESAICKLGYEGRATHISTGKKSALKLIEGGALPGVLKLMNL